MPEENVLSLAEQVLPAIVEEASCRLGCIDRVQEDTFKGGEYARCLEGGERRDSIAVPEEGVVNVDLDLPYAPGPPQFAEQRVGNLHYLFGDRCSGVIRADAEDTQILPAEEALALTQKQGESVIPSL